MTDTYYVTPKEVILHNLHRCLAPRRQDRIPVLKVRYFPLAHDLRYVTWNHLTGKLRTVQEPFGLSEFDRLVRPAGPQ